MVLSDAQIREQIKINPLSPSQKRPGEISYGLTSYGYDITLGNRFRIADPWGASNSKGMIDPKNIDDRCFTAAHVYDHEKLVIPPHSFVLAETKEHIEIPRDVIAICVGKSTYARCGIIVNVTPLEPEWKGVVTLEISNTTPLPAVIYPGEGIAQVLFLRGEQPCEQSYADKKGKYQDQTGLELPRVDK